MINNYFQDQYQSWHKVYHDKYTSNGIFLGDVSSALNQQFIKRENIKTVITAALGMDHVKFQPQIKHIIYPILDAKHESISNLFNEFIQIVDGQITQGSILVHCFAGVSRSATLVIAYLMNKFNYSFRQAIDYVRQSRPTVCPNLGFQMQLKQYQKKLKKSNKNSRSQRRTNSKTSQSNKHKLLAQNNIELQLPQINASALGGSHLKSKILKPTFGFFPQKNTKHVRKQQNYEPIKFSIKPVFKPRSLSNADKKYLNIKKDVKAKFLQHNELRLQILQKLGVNNKQGNYATQRIPQLRINKKYANFLKS